MSMVCFDVYKTEQASKRWRQAGNANSNSMSRAGKSSKSTIFHIANHFLIHIFLKWATVFWQSFWYLMVFYLTWPPYLALQYLWSSGKAYSMYGLVLFAGTVVPLQGFWNCIAFKRGPIAKFIKSTKTSLTSRLTNSLVGLSSLSKNVSNAVPSNVNSSVAVEAANEKGPLSNTDANKEVYDKPEG